MTGVADGASSNGARVPSRGATTPAHTATTPARATSEADLPSDDASALVQVLGDVGMTLACAESLTGGLVADAVVRVPGASVVFRGGVVSYATDVKASVLGVDEGILAEAGPVDPRVAEQMASGVRALLAADLSVATTGVAGPGRSDGHDAGLVYVGVAGPDGTSSRELHLRGGRGEVRRAAAREAVAAVLEVAEALRSARHTDR